MTKADWLRKQIDEAFEGLSPPTAGSFDKLLAAVAAGGRNLSRAGFARLVESFKPEDGPGYYDFMILDTQLSYCADFTEAWDFEQSEPLPEITTRSRFRGIELPSDFIRLGGEPEWIQNEDRPFCEECDNDMALFAQFKSLPADLAKANSELNAYVFGDQGALYVFTCPTCSTFKTEWQCH